MSPVFCCLEQYRCPKCRCGLNTTRVKPDRQLLNILQEVEFVVIRGMGRGD